MKTEIETIGEPRRLLPGVKIVAVSGRGRVNSVHDLQIAQKMGAVATLQKPFFGEALVEALARAGG